MLKAIRDLLVEVIAKIDAGSSNVTDEDAKIIVGLLKKYTDKDERLSKYSACEYLGISRASFDGKVSVGEIPHGLKKPGFKELSWSKKDLDEYIAKTKKEEYGR